MTRCAALLLVIEDSFVDLCSIPMRGSVEDSATHFTDDGVNINGKHFGMRANAMEYSWALLLCAAAEQSSIPDAFCLRLIKSAMDYSIKLKDGVDLFQPTSAPAAAAAAAVKVEPSDAQPAVKEEPADSADGAKNAGVVAAAAGSNTDIVPNPEPVASAVPTSPTAGTDEEADESEPGDGEVVIAISAAGYERAAALLLRKAEWQALPSVYKHHKQRRVIDRRFDGSPERRTRHFSDDEDGDGGDYGAFGALAMLAHRRRRGPRGCTVS